MEPVTTRMHAGLVSDAIRVVESRRAVYGDPASNLQHTADMWTALMWPELHYRFTAHDVCQFMRLVKEARLRTSPGHPDSLCDIVGYTDCDVQIYVKEASAPDACHDPAPPLEPAVRTATLSGS